MFGLPTGPTNKFFLNINEIISNSFSFLSAKGITPGLYKRRIKLRVSYSTEIGLIHEWFALYRESYCIWVVPLIFYLNFGG